jgi:hypothetical protein
MGDNSNISENVKICREYRMAGKSNISWNVKTNTYNENNMYFIFINIFFTYQRYLILNHY